MFFSQMCSVSVCVLYIICSVIVHCLIMLITEEHTRYDPNKSKTSTTGGNVECNYRDMGNMDCEQVSDTICVSQCSGHSMEPVYLVPV